MFPEHLYNNSGKNIPRSVDKREHEAQKFSFGEVWQHRGNSLRFFFKPRQSKKIAQLFTLTAMYRWTSSQKEKKKDLNSSY